MTTSRYGPEVISYPLTTAAYSYLIKMRDYGALEGPIGDMRLNPLLEPIVRALHTVIAGGEVRVEVVSAGNPAITAELEGLFHEAERAGNEINRKAGYYVTLGI